MNNITVGSALQDEWKKILRDRVIFVILLVGPIFYTFFFASLYNQRAVTEIPTIVYDEDHSELSQEIIQAMDAHQSINIVGEVYSNKEVREAIDNGKARAAVVIPYDLEAKLKHGTVTPVITFVDGSNLMITNSVIKGANEVIATYSFGASSKKLQQQGLQDEQISTTLSNIPFSARTLYNPTFDYEDFLVIGMAATTLQQVIFMAVGMSVAREKEDQTWDRFAVWKRSPWKIAFVKMFPYFIVSVLNVFVVLSILTSVFKLSFHGSVWSILLAGVVFSFTVSSIGYLLSLVAPNKIVALQISMLVALPSFSLSGHSWPLEAMPKFMSFIAHGLPLTYFLDSLRTVMLKGLPTHHILNNCVATAVIGLITLLSALLYSRFISFRKLDEGQQTAMVDHAAPVTTQSFSAASSTTTSV